MTTTVIEGKWHTTAEVADMLGFGLSKTKMLVLTGEIRSVKVGRNRRIFPSWVDEYIQRVTTDTADVEGWAA
ncbi:excisionase family DNA-binding protein [Streptomyces boluensis]|uniref:Excisionase family DNA-binding protein n=1 Tax=Streptomyces boluensis TaxID=1775135 RepID=A0A964V028_9ACTN|nr:excisionase family DNA-binding protein [Streptomyces boluensis]NBE56087.1 excisionase family DNA-binding protein [Streptomyces boluensis]